MYPSFRLSASSPVTTEPTSQNLETFKSVTELLLSFNLLKKKRAAAAARPKRALELDRHGPRLPKLQVRTIPAALRRLRPRSPYGAGAGALTEPVECCSEWRGYPAWRCLTLTVLQLVSGRSTFQDDICVATTNIFAVARNCSEERDRIVI